MGYSPDDIPMFFFCAYHGSVDFSDSVGHALFSVEPYPAVEGCAVTTPPNGKLADSTANVRSHELIETIPILTAPPGWR